MTQVHEPLSLNATLHLDLTHFTNHAGWSQEVMSSPGGDQPWSRRIIHDRSAL